MLRSSETGAKTDDLMVSVRGKSFGSVWVTDNLSHWLIIRCISLYVTSWSRRQARGLKNIPIKDM